MTPMYGKLINGRIEAAPGHLVIDGKMVLRPSPLQLKTAGYKRVIDVIPDKPAPIDKEWRATEWHEGGLVITRRWKLFSVSKPTRTFRRSWLAQWLRAHGKWDAFKGLLAQSDDLSFFWETSTEFDDDHPMWDGAMASMKAALQLTDLEVQEFLDYGATGREPDSDNSDNSNDTNE